MPDVVAQRIKLLSVPLPIQLTTNVPEKAMEYGPSSWASLEAPNGVPGSWLSPGPALAIVAIWSEPVDGRFFSVPL